MKYSGQPNCHIMDYENNKEVFCFDEKGEYETEDTKLIKWMKENKNFIKCENNAIKSDKLICKKCGLKFENKGLLLSHYKKHKGDE